MSPSDGAPEEFDQTIFAVRTDRTVGPVEGLALNLVKEQQRYTVWVWLTPVMTYIFLKFVYRDGFWVFVNIYQILEGYPRLMISTGRCLCSMYICFLKVLFRFVKYVVGILPLWVDPFSQFKCSVKFGCWVKVRYPKLNDMKINDIQPTFNSSHSTQGF